MFEPVVPAPVEELIAALPKVELHVHLEGSMQPALLLELAAKHGVVGLPASLAAVREWYEFRDFPHFVDVYLAAVQTLRDQEDFALLVAQTAATLAAQNVRYAEVIDTPWLHLDRGIAAEHVFGGLERGREVAERWRNPRPGPYLVGHSSARRGTYRPRNPLPRRPRADRIPARYPVAIRRVPDVELVHRCRFPGPVAPATGAARCRTDGDAELR